MKKLCISMILAAMGCSGCSSIIDGTSQEIKLNTNPAGAMCKVERKGDVIASAGPTPTAVTIKKTKDDITVLCVKDGYQEATYLNHSGTADATFGNLVLGGGIGWAIDSASGADNHYEPAVNITLVPAAAASAAKVAQ